jgi:hypothetical protein
MNFSKVNIAYSVIYKNKIYRGMSSKMPLIVTMAALALASLGLDDSTQIEAFLYVLRSTREASTDPVTAPVILSIM